jgi:hypothetical protein
VPEQYARVKIHDAQPREDKGRVMHMEKDQGTENFWVVVKSWELLKDGRCAEIPANFVYLVVGEGKKVSYVELEYGDYESSEG